jgi:hypothetical protein
LSSSRHCCDDQAMVSHSVCMRKKKDRDSDIFYSHSRVFTRSTSDRTATASSRQCCTTSGAIRAKTAARQKRETTPTVSCHHRVSVGQDSPSVCFSIVMTTLPSESDHEHPSGTTLPNKVNEMGAPPSTATSSFDTANLTFTALLFVPGGAGTDTSTCKRAWLKTWRVCVRACACACGLRACGKRVQHVAA